MIVPGAAAFVVAVLGGLGPAAKPSPTRTQPPTTPAVRLTPAQKNQAQKTLHAEVGKRQSLREKQRTPPKASAKFQAHRCAVIYDETVSGRQREANGPFRVSCSDWVQRATRDLSVKDGERPCTIKDYGPLFAGCVTWVDGWDEKRGKWAELWRQAPP